MIVPPPDLDAHSPMGESPPDAGPRPPCPVCGTSMDGRNKGARFCCAACRVEAWRVKRLLAGDAVGPYTSLHDRLGVWGHSGAPRAVRATKKRT